MQHDKNVVPWAGATIGVSAALVTPVPELAADLSPLVRLAFVFVLALLLGCAAGFLLRRQVGVGVALGFARHAAVAALALGIAMGLGAVLAVLTIWMQTDGGAGLPAEFVRLHILVAPLRFFAVVYPAALVAWTWTPRAAGARRARA